MVTSGSAPLSDAPECQDFCLQACKAQTQWQALCIEQPGPKADDDPRCNPLDERIARIPRARYEACGCDELLRTHDFRKWDPQQPSAPRVDEPKIFEKGEAP
jgi:hypothetical protein